MVPGDVIFVKGNGLLGEAIRYFDPGEYSHVCIAVSSDEIFEAQGLTKSRITKMTYTDFDIIHTNMTTHEQAKLKVLCQLLEGKPYDYIQDLGYVFRDLFHTNESKFNNPNELICSEAISLVLYILDKLDAPHRNITPNELAELMRKIKY